MNRDDIIRMALEAGFTCDEADFVFPNPSRSGIQLELERFAALVAAAEREACAKVCEEPGWNAANWCAKQIRARGNNA